MYRNRTIFAIAINDYDGVHCERLDNAVYDAQRLIKVLQERYGFGTACEPLFNDQATGENIEEALYSISAGSYAEDVLIIFFAGHGGQDDFSKTGFWHPFDGQDRNRKSKLLWNSRILEAINTMKFKHILLISDSCYSGTFITRVATSTLPSTLGEADTLESRWVFVSGGEENVKDGHIGTGSPFMNSIYKFLETNKKRQFPATDLFAAVKRDFAGPGLQQPQASPLNSPGHNGGILVFENSDPVIKEEAEKHIGAFPLPPGPPPGYYIGRTVSPRSGELSLTSLFMLETDKKKLSDLIEYESRLVVLGNAGSGKSRELIRLWELLTHSGGRFQPVYKRFNTYVNQPISDFLPAGWENIDPFMAVYLLDGLDEVQPQYFANAVRSIEEFVAAHPDSKFVISCRTNFYELPGQNFSGTLSSFSVYELNDLSLSEIKTYVSVVRGLDGERFLQEAHRHRLMDLVQKPFFLELLLQYFEHHGSLTYQRSAIIQNALIAQLTTNRQRLNATEHGRKLDNDTALRMLEKIGFVMEQMGKNYLSDEDLRTLFPDFEERELVKELPSFFHDDLNSRWQFEHNNIQEYLAASVLKKLPIEKILELVTIPGVNKIKPSWVNTLSFFVSIGDKPIVNALLDWLVQYESGFILRFEPERLPDETRIKVALDIIETHARENIWFSSTIFSEQDIARIGAFPEVIHHLQADLDSPTSTVTVKMNAFRVLRYIDFDSYPADKKAFCDSLFQLVKKEDTPDHFKYSAMNTLGELQLLEPTDVNTIVNQYKNDINAYVRAGLYSLLIATGQVDTYLDVFLDGINPDAIANPTGERSTVSLLDEQTRLVNGLSKITSADSVKRLLERFRKPGQWRHFSREDNTAILNNVVTVAIASYQNDTSIFSSMLAATILSAEHFEHDTCARLSDFFKSTGTAYEALGQVLARSKDFVKGELIPYLVDSTMIGFLMEEFQAQRLSEDQIRQIHAAFSWHKRSLRKGQDQLEELEKAFLQDTGTDLKGPDLPVLLQPHQADPQLSVDLLFDRTRFREGAIDYYQRIGKQEISWEDVVSFRSQNRDEYYADSPVFTFFSDYFQGPFAQPLEATLKFLETPRFDSWTMVQVYRKLEDQGDPLIVLSEDQVKAIIHWVQETIERLDLRVAIDQSYDIVRVLWYFIRRFQVAVPPEKLLLFSLYYDFKAKVNLEDAGTIDELEKLTPKDKLLATVVENIWKPDQSPLAWLNSASYAVTHQLTDSYPLIAAYLVKTSDSEYKYQQLLELWAKQGDGFAQINIIAETANNTSLRLSALELMAKKAGFKETASTILANMLDDVRLEMHERLEAAKQLIRLDDARGVAFIASQIDTAYVKANWSDFGLIHPLGEIKTLEALPYILRLIAVALRPDVKSHDEMGFFFSRLLEGLFNIGMQSSTSLAEVDKQVTAFIAENEGHLVELEVLKVNLRRLHERFNSAHAQPLTLQEAIAEYQKI